MPDVVHQMLVLRQRIQTKHCLLIPKKIKYSIQFEDRRSELEKKEKEKKEKRKKKKKKKKKAKKKKKKAASSNNNNKK